MENVFKCRDKWFRVVTKKYPSEVHCASCVRWVLHNNIGCKDLYNAAMKAGVPACDRRRQILVVYELVDPMYGTLLEAKEAADG